MNSSPNFCGSGLRFWPTPAQTHSDTAGMMVNQIGFDRVYNDLVVYFYGFFIEFLEWAYDRI